MHVQLESKDHYVISSGSVISFNGDPLVLKMPLVGEDLTFVFSFSSDLDNPDKPTLRVIPHGERKLEIQFVNFDCELGTGNLSPVEVGSIDDKTLFLNYRVYILSNSDCRLLHYTLYQEK